MCQGWLTCVTANSYFLNQNVKNRCVGIVRCKVKYSYLIMFFFLNFVCHFKLNIQASIHQSFIHFGREVERSKAAMAILKFENVDQQLSLVKYFFQSEKITDKTMEANSQADPGEPGDPHAPPLFCGENLVVYIGNH